MDSGWVRSLNLIMLHSYYKSKYINLRYVGIETSFSTFSGNINSLEVTYNSRNFFPELLYYLLTQASVLSPTFRSEILTSFTTFSYHFPIQDTFFRTRVTIEFSFFYQNRLNFFTLSFFEIRKLIFLLFVEFLF